MADSLRDYFIKFIFKTDTAGLAAIKNGLTSVENGLDRSAKKAFSFNEKIAAVKNILAPFRELGEMVSRTAEEADALGDLADRTGMATDEIEKLGYIAKLSGTSQETLMHGLRHLDKTLGEVAQGSKQQVETFAKLGISAYGMNGKLKTTQELLPDVARAFAKIPGHAQKTAYAMQLFGRAGQELLPMLEKGPDALEAMRKELELIGGITSESFLKAGSDYADNVDKLTAAWKGVRQAISGPIIDAINKISAGFLQWWKVWGQLVRSKMSEWAGQLVTSLGALWTTLGKVGGVLLLVAAAFHVPLLAMIALKLLIVLLIEDFANFMADNDSIIGRVIANWDEWLNKIAETHPILATIAATVGDVFSFLWKTAGGAFYMIDAIINGFLDNGWSGFVKEMGDIWTTAWKAWAESIYKFLEPVFKQLTEFVTNVQELLGGVTNGVRSVGQMLGIGGPSSDARAPGSSVLTPQGISNATSNNQRSTNNVQASISVQAAPGMNERSLADEIKKRFDMEMDSQLRGAYNVTVPESY